MDGETCGNCRFYHLLGERYGAVRYERDGITKDPQRACRRRPEYVGRFADDWCGEWTAMRAEMLGATGPD